jgi:hypothetical protein
MPSSSWNIRMIYLGNPSEIYIYICLRQSTFTVCHLIYLWYIIHSQREQDWMAWFFFLFNSLSLWSYISLYSSGTMNACLLQTCLTLPVLPYCTDPNPRSHTDAASTTINEYSTQVWKSLSVLYLKFNRRWTTFFARMPALQQSQKRISKWDLQKFSKFSTS